MAFLSQEKCASFWEYQVPVRSLVFCSLITRSATDYLGKPTGCSTFLKVIANQRGEYPSVTGDVKYAGIDSSEMAKRFSGEVVYNQEGELNAAIVTITF